MAFPQSLLGVLSLGDVAQAADERSTIADSGLAHGQVRGKDRSVFAPADDLAAEADDRLPTRSNVILQVTIVLEPVGIGHQELHVLADHLVPGVTEHPLGGRIEGLDDAALVDDDEGIDGGGQDGFRAGLAIAQGLFGALAIHGLHAHVFPFPKRQRSRNLAVIVPF